MRVPSQKNKKIGIRKKKICLIILVSTRQGICSLNIIMRIIRIRR